MKYIILLFFVLVSCTEHYMTPDNTNIKNTVTGKWNIIKDSMYQGAGPSNHLVVYNGQSGDYFDFKTDGKVYTKEGLDLDTLDYEITGASKIVISSFPDTCNLLLDVNSLSIVSHELDSPGGVEKRSVYLSRGCWIIYQPLFTSQCSNSFATAVKKEAPILPSIMR